MAGAGGAGRVGHIPYNIAAKKMDTGRENRVDLPHEAGGGRETLRDWRDAWPRRAPFLPTSSGAPDRRNPDCPFSPLRLEPWRLRFLCPRKECES